MDSRFAPAVIQVAKEEATPQPYGKVNDKFFEPGVEKGLRFGWKRLKEYFEVAGKWTEAHWRMPGYLDGVKLNNKRVTQPGTSGLNWCGIFATWVWIKAGVPGVSWGFPGVKGPNVKKVAGYKGIGLGDIAVLNGALVHHCIISDIKGDVDNGSAQLETINGNSDYQGITIKPITLQQINCYYTIEDKFYDMLKAQYGQ